MGGKSVDNKRGRGRGSRQRQTEGEGQISKRQKQKEKNKYCRPTLPFTHTALRSAPSAVEGTEELDTLSKKRTMTCMRTSGAAT